MDFGPSGRVRARSSDKPTWDPTAGEHVSIEDLHQCAKVYAALILDVCTRDREEVLGGS